MDRIRVDKWGLKFNGESEQFPVEDFIFRLERLQREYGVPWAEVLRDFHLLVSGHAYKWYWLLVKSTNITEWEVLRGWLLQQYQSNISNGELTRDMWERKQQSGESIDNYFYVMNSMRSRLHIPISDYEMIRLLKANVRENIRLILFSLTVSTVEQLRAECIAAERALGKRPAPLTYANPP